MDVATSSVEVGVRDLKNNLSRYLERVRAGEEVIITDRGRPVARLLGVDASTDRRSLPPNGIADPRAVTETQR